MAKALLGHLGGTDPRMLEQVRLLNRRVADLEAHVMRLQAENDHLVAAVHDGRLLTVDEALRAPASVWHRSHTQYTRSTHRRPHHARRRPASGPPPVSCPQSVDSSAEHLPPGSGSVTGSYDGSLRFRLSFHGLGATPCT